MPEQQPPHPELERAARRLRDADQEIERLRARLAAQVAEREELVTVVSHELRTPLTVIAGFNKLLLSERVGALNEEQRRFLAQSERSCRRLDAFIGNLIEAARQSARQDALELCEASLEASVRGVVEFLRPLLEERGLRVELRLAPDAARARFHPLRVEQVLTNLIGNAVRYAPKGSCIEVATQRSPSAAEELVEVAVSDEGPGIAPADRERIFGLWVRGSDGHEAGLGLGLAICKRIVEAHGGTIRVGAAAGGGSRFVFTLPAPAGEGAPPAAREGAPPALRESR
jgi:two-component system sensor histidine kinase KdpD